MHFEHTSVMPVEVDLHLNLKPGDVCVDGTLGGAGHASQMVKRISPEGTFIGIDQDMDAIVNAYKKLSCKETQITIVHDNFSHMPQVLDKLQIPGVDAILLDLGLSLHQLRKGQRGFSFLKDEPLDMRMDKRQGLTAADIVNTFTLKALTDLFFSYGEERMSRQIARKIVDLRRQSPIMTSARLADIIVDTVPAKIARNQKIHPATRVFQALRIKVNRELERLEKIMKEIPQLLNPGGRICIIAFHSLEDRIVKHGIRAFEEGCTCPRDFPQCTCGFTPSLRSISRKPFMPTAEECIANPMARSARLRVAERI
ncbi:16S rRNA (cytosine1402-N4)-methyltransferase [Desulfocicer vacuolatum DSM 3385]|uniref:Ribosomal RNA small subunit methyltransferase H n=1 Tax=Desulfocicer vacuolatum DSM 3385 TaxID=1121400 RepID=A0A1W1YH72_9BACT|nr:16S rRNA (cytosine(1402)-N(4))-methyltransferase RsmH [Desulfocicer vacuolatum]SMC35493.1 16S rRNA (cytosine1402-N4)-methyltransferase [Desulfocicer vacuolatum DSM 3385]